MIVDIMEAPQVTLPSNLQAYISFNERDNTGFAIGNEGKKNLFVGIEFDEHTAVNMYDKYTLFCKPSPDTKLIRVKKSDSEIRTHLTQVSFTDLFSFITSRLANNPSAGNLEKAINSTQNEIVKHFGTLLSEFDDNKVFDKLRNILDYQNQPANHFVGYDSSQERFCGLIIEGDPVRKVIANKIYAESISNEDLGFKKFTITMDNPLVPVLGDEAIKYLSTSQNTITLKSSPLKSVK